MARFFVDVLVFNYFPYHLPTAILAIMICLLVYFLSVFSIATAVISWGLLYLGLSWTVLQSQIVDHRGRLQLGMFVGAIISLAVSCFHTILPKVSIIYKLLLGVFAGLSMYYCFVVIKAKPLCSRHESKSDLARKIINSSPFEGTDEETISIMKEGGGDGVQNKIIKDAFTGRIEIVRPTVGASDDECVPKARTLGPKICGHCLSDKRSISYHSRVPDKENQGSAASLSEHAVGIISLATHCHYCNQCVIDQDHHSIFLGQCIGKGNRREFVILLICASITNLLYFCAMKYIQYNELLPQDMKYVSSIF